MDEDVTDQTAGVPQSGPAAAAGGGTVIEAFPGELGAGGAIARAVAHVEIGFDGEKRKFTAVFATEGNVRRSGQVDLVSLVHLGDPPSPGKGPGRSSARVSSCRPDQLLQSDQIVCGRQGQRPIDLGQPPELGLAQPATLLIQPKASSMRLRTRWLAA